MNAVLFIGYKRGLPGAIRDYVTISLWNSPMQIDLRAQRALGWGEPPTNKKFIHKPTPRSNFCLLAPAQFSKHTLPFGRVDPAGSGLGWKNNILLYKPIPRSNFCLLAPVQFLILQGISDGVTIGIPLGVNIWGSPPGSVSSPGEMRSPC
jgi:hypothetical protein